MSLRDHIAEIETTYGRGIVAQGSRGSFVTNRFQMMMFDLDAAIGGGPPWGKFVLAFGPPSGGKSVLLYKALAGAQNYCRWCRDLFRVDEYGVETCSCATGCEDCGEEYERTAYDGPEAAPNDPFDWAIIHDEWTCGCMVQPGSKRGKKHQVPRITRRSTRCRAILFDAENSFDVNWATCLGVDPDYLFVFVPEYAEQGIDIADKLLRSEEVDFFGVDSIAELVPSKEIESSTEEWQIGLQARLVNKAMRKWGASMNSFGANAPRKPVVWMVNQVRSNIGGYAEETTPGGRGEGFKSSIRIRVNAAQYKFKSTGDKGDKVKELQFVDISGYTHKNKTYTPKKKFACRLYLADHEGHPAGSTNEFEVVKTRAIEFGVIDRPKPNEYCYGDYKWSSQKAIVEDLQTNFGLFWEIRDKTMLVVVEALR